MVPVTRLYPDNMEGIIVDNLQFINESYSQKIYIIARTDDLADLPEKNKRQIKFKGENYSVVSYN